MKGLHNYLVTKPKLNCTYMWRACQLCVSYIESRE